MEDREDREDGCLTRRELIRTAAGALAVGALAAMEDESEAAVGTLPRRVLGKTGVRVPILGFGTASCGIRRNLRNGADLYNRAIDAGVNYMDTAPLNTGYGIAQKQLGVVLKDRRREVFLVTKTHESDGDAALRLLERNLKELQTDHADLVYAHSLGSLDMETALGKNGVFAALQKAKREGLTRFVGVSGHHRPARFLRAMAEYPLDVMMCAVNFVDRNTYNFEERVLPVAAEKNIGLAAMKVFGGANWQDKGMSNRMLPPEHLESGLRYALSLPRVAVAVIGMATEEELRRNLLWARRFQPLTAREREALRPVGRALAQKWGEHFGAVS